ncbi:hypothetical protein [Streptomyces fructofermentans]|uniref:Uncharacterized protein n=1 Tax=Streptomyces fructofermentans TaxID=152141 RepID=A0A918U4Y9_9ACTN|nr:hypothetical protein [Streptomyces fructofermentans]GGX93109.1 hypothetical protein GCM10010515_70050 [Streptomyces fructofermentans]
MQQLPELDKHSLSGLGNPDRWAKFRGLTWWQTVLSVAPMLLMVLGGAIGGVMATLGLFANLSIARKPLGTPVKLLAMLGVVFASCLSYILVVGYIRHLFQ